MSLVTDKFFARVLQSSEEINDIVGGRIYNTVDDEINPDTADVPSLFIMNHGTTNNDTDKDEGYESSTDNDSITIGICARSREELGTIATLVRETIKSDAANYTSSDWQTLGFTIMGYNFTASNVSFDYMKPCYWQELRYSCETYNH